MTLLDILGLFQLIQVTYFLDYTIPINCNTLKIIFINSSDNI